MEHYFSSAAIAYGACFAAALMFAPQVFAIQTFTVNTTLDQADADPNDHVCQTSTDVTIIVPACTYTLSTPSVFYGGDDLSELTLATPTSGNPAVTIVRADASTTIIDGNGHNRVFLVGASRTATIARSRSAMVHGHWAEQSSIPAR